MRWKKGESGNISGRPAGLAEVSRKALAACPAIMDELIAMALDKSIDNKVRLSAMKEVLDRGMGKAIQAVRIESQDNKEPSKITTQELELMLKGGLDLFKEQLREQIKNELIPVDTEIIPLDNNVIDYQGKGVNLRVSENSETDELEHRLEYNVNER